MISLLGWPTLESRRSTLRTLMMYKIMNNLVDMSTNTILLPSTLQLRGNTEKLQLPCRLYFQIGVFKQIQTKYTIHNIAAGNVYIYIYSFFPQVIKLWNSLPQHLISSADFHTFKERLYNYYLLIAHTHTAMLIFESVH